VTSLPFGIINYEMDTTAQNKFTFEEAFGTDGWFVPISLSIEIL